MSARDPGAATQGELMAPKRIQRKRTKGWRMPEGAVYVGRPTKWGNPYTGRSLDPETGRVVTDRKAAVDLFRAYAARIPAHFFAELVGRDLACWCPLSSPCHGDILLEIANEVAREHA